MTDRQVINKKGGIIDESAVTDFGVALRGSLVRPRDDNYDIARKVWNGMIDRFPSMIVYCANENDVMNAVRFAGANDLLVAVRSGGHNVAGNAVCDGGMVIDLSGMKKIEVDAESQTVIAQAGLTLGDLDRGNQAFGMANLVPS